MCKWSHLKIGQTVTLQDDGTIICDNCASYQPKQTSQLTYLGHAMISRYGVCDIFRYKAAQLCPICGYQYSQWIDPCENGMGIPESIEQEKIPVRMIGHA